MFKTKNIKKTERELKVNSSKIILHNRLSLNPQVAHEV